MEKNLQYKPNLGWRYTYRLVQFMEAVILYKF